MSDKYRIKDRKTGLYVAFGYVEGDCESPTWHTLESQGYDGFSSEDLNTFIPDLSRCGYDVIGEIIPTHLYILCMAAGVVPEIIGPYTDEKTRESTINEFLTREHYQLIKAVFMKMDIVDGVVISQIKKHGE